MNKLSLAKMLSNNLVKGKNVLMRVDFNVPIRDGVITDSRRIDEALASVDDLLKSDMNKLTIVSHRGRPGGKLQEKFTLAPVYEQLKTKYDLEFKHGLIDESALKMHSSMSKRILLLDNVRQHAEEEGKFKDASGTKVKVDKAKVDAFRALLNRFGDAQVNDAFGCSHRAHSSIVGSSHEFRASGHLLSKEIDYFSAVLNNPNRPMAAIVGGAKVSDKMLLLENLINKVDKLLIGGAMANSFVHNLYGVPMGKSLLEKDENSVKVCRQVVDQAKSKGVELVFPSDFVTARDMEATSGAVKTALDEDDMAFDIGPASTLKFIEVLNGCNTLVWNGPVGLFEKDAFANGTKDIFHKVCSKKGFTTIVCGGDTGSAAKKFEAETQVSHISTGGGASLEVLEGKILPGIQSLSDDI